MESELNSTVCPHISRAGRPNGFALLLAVVAVVPALAQVEQKPEDKSKERDAWQRPVEVMDALGVKAGSVVADVGAGSGYFSFHLAARVGPTGKVYAEDIDPKRLNQINERVRKENLAQIEMVLGSADDPKLPAAALDAILVVDSFHEMAKYDAMLQGMYRALKTGGMLGIIDRKADSGQPRSYYLEHHRIPQELVLEDVKRNGFDFLREGQSFKGPSEAQKYFFLIFEKLKPAAKPQ